PARAQNGATLALLGRAQSNARVSPYMRNLDASGWMGNPDLDIIELRGSDPGLPNESSLKVKLKSPNQVDPSAPPAEAGAPAPLPDGSAPLPAPAADAAPPSPVGTAAPANISPTAPAPAPAPPSS